ncbi:MAG TPA: cupin domain-containing protein [Pseudonocardiaceae bacterium]|jgi:hypothetical protein
MFAIPEHSVLPPVTHHPLSPTAVVRSVGSDPLRWRGLLASATAIGRPVLEPLTLPLPSEDPRVTTWLTVWPAGHRGTLRGYDAHQGAFAVLSGQVIEHAGGRVRTLRPGQVRIFGPGYRHRVRNAGAEQAVTVHVQIERD